MDSRKNGPAWWTWLIAGIAGLLGYGLIAVVVASAFDPGGDAQMSPISINDLAQEVKDAQVKSVQMIGSRGVATTFLDQRYSFRIGDGTDFLNVLAAYDVTPDEMTNVEFVVMDTPPIARFLRDFPSVGPMLFLTAFAFLLMRLPARDTNEQLLNFAKSRARRFAYERTLTRFQDVAGADEAKQELQEIVEFLKYPQRFAELGARFPKGVLLVGAPGVGKTLLSRAVAGEAWVPFYSIAGPEFVEMLVGVGASRVRDLFEEARHNAPCIVFIDEIDAVGRRRGVGLGSGSDERDQTLNQILVEMDGFECNTGVCVIAATNRPDVLDPALLRPGRLDRRVELPAPDCRGRQAILEVHARGKPMDESVDFSILARITPGFSGADLANLINEGAILAARHNHTTIGMQELEEGMDRVLAGPEV